MLVRIFTAYPEYFSNTLDISLLKHTKNSRIWQVEIINLRDYGIGKHKKIDDTTAGGGAGLILRADVLANALESNIQNIENISNSPDRALILTSPRGKKFNQEYAQNLAKLSELNIVCNRFEGVDQRVIDYYNMQEISIGDYILLGGEVGVCVILEATLRLIENFIPNHQATHEESFSTALNGKLEYPHYTQPNCWKNLEIPETLRSGNHAEIAKWRSKNSKEQD